MRVIFEGRSGSTIEPKLESGNIVLVVEEPVDGFRRVSLTIEETDLLISRLVQLIDQKELEDSRHLSFFERMKKPKSKWTK